MAIAWNVSSSVEIVFENENCGQVTSRCFSPRHEWCLGTGLLKDRVYYCVQIGLLAASLATQPCTASAKILDRRRDPAFHSPHSANRCSSHPAKTAHSCLATIRTVPLGVDTSRFRAAAVNPRSTACRNHVQLPASGRFAPIDPALTRGAPKEQLSKPFIFNRPFCGRFGPNRRSELGGVPCLRAPATRPGQSL